MNEIGQSMDERNFDMAVFLIKQLIENNFDSHFINLSELLQEAEKAVEFG